MEKLKKIGEDVRISELAQIMRPELVEVGNHIAIDQWVYISTQLVLGDYIHIAPHVSIIGGAPALLTMEDFTNIGSGSKIVCATDDFTQGLISPVVPIEHRTVINKPVVFKRFATLGVNCTVLPGVTLAEGTIVGANSVVTKDTEPWMIYAGCPAKPIKPRERERAIESAKKLGYSTDKKFITNEIFPHGLGTRVFLLTNAIAYSIISGIEFVITPFSYQTSKNEFKENPMNHRVDYISDTKRWDSLLNLDRKKITDIVNLSEVLYLAHPSSNNHVPPVSEQFELYNKIRGLRNIIKNEYLNIPTKIKTDVISVAVHIRRGDIMNFKERFIDNNYYINQINTLEDFFKINNIKYEITIYTQKSGFNINGFENFKIIYDTDMDDNKTWVRILNSDIILGGNSAFSTSVGMLTDGIYIHPDPSNFIHMTDWLYGDNLTHETMSEKFKHLK